MYAAGVTPSPKPIPAADPPGLVRELVLDAVPAGHIAVSLHDVPEPQAVVVLCHGIGGDRLGPAGLFADLAAAGVRTGCAVVRFDFRGAGESSGDGMDTSLGDMLTDLDGVLGWARELSGGGVLIASGHSVGGIVAGLAAAGKSSEPIEGAVLLSCDLGPYDYGKDDPVFFARDIDYFPGRFAVERAPVDLRAAPFSCPVAFVAGEDERPEILATMATLAGRLPVIRVPGADHLLAVHRMEAAAAFERALCVVLTTDEGT